MGIRGFGMVKVTCSDLDRSISFYQKLGFSLASRSERVASADIAQLYDLTDAFARTATLDIVGRTAVQLELIEWLPSHSHAAHVPANTVGMAMFSLMSDDLDADLASIADEGGGSIGKPFAFQQGAATIRLANAHDPDGLALQLVQVIRN